MLNTLLHGYKVVCQGNATVLRTKVSIAGLAELSSSTKTEIERQLIGFAQLASILNSSKSILGVIIRHKPIVVPVTEEWGGRYINIHICIFISKLPGAKRRSGVKFVPK